MYRHNSIYVFVDRLTKMIRLAANNPECTAAAVALFHNHVDRYHGPPREVVLNRDPVFFSKCLKALMNRFQIKSIPRLPIISKRTGKL